MKTVVCCRVHNFHPLGWTPSTTTSTTTLKPSIIFTVDNIDNILVNMNITDINDVSQWNAGFDYINGGPTNSNYISVNVIGNTIILYGTADLIYFASIGLLSFTLVGLFPSTTDIVIDSTPNTLLLDLNIFSSLHFPVLISLFIGSCGLTNFNMTSLLSPVLKGLSLSGNNLVDFNPSITLPSTLEYLCLASNKITDFNPTIPLPSSLKVFDISSNLLVNFAPIVSFPNIEQFTIGNNINLNTFDSNILQSNLLYLFLDTCNLDNTSVNNILSKGVDLGLSTGHIIYMQGGTNSPPTGQGIIDKQTLITQGCDVVTN